MIVYLIKSTLCMGLFLGLYHLLFAREKLHQFNRAFLLGSLLASLSIPLLTVRTKWVEHYERVLYPATAQFRSVPIAPAQMEAGLYDLTIGDWFTGIYLLGFLLMIVRFGNNLKKMADLIRAGEKKRLSQATLVQHEQVSLPFSFLHFVFVNRALYQNGALDPLLLAHEQIHVQQRHSWDILLLEVLHAFLWFNPLIMLYQRAIRLNHEYLVDEALITEMESAVPYLQLLVQTAGSSLQPALASPYHFGSTKNRITMILQPSPSRHLYRRQWLVLPFLLCMAWTFGQTTEKQLPPPPPTQPEHRLPPPPPTQPQHRLPPPPPPMAAGTQQLPVPASSGILVDYDFVNGGMYAYQIIEGTPGRQTIAMIPGSTQVSFLDEQGHEIVKLAKELALAEKKRYWELSASQARFWQTPPEQKRITQDLLDQLLDPQQYGVWVDGQRTDNAMLREMTVQDIHHFYLSKLAPNAKNYGQFLYQADLYTQSRFDEDFAGRKDGWWIQVVPE